MVKKNNPRGGNGSAKADEPFFFAKYPIFDADQNLWGYDLHSRLKPKVNGAIVSKYVDGEAEKGSNLPRILSLGVRLLMSVADRSSLAGVVSRENAGLIHFRIPERIYSAQSIVKAMKKLASDGFKVALEPAPGSPHYDAILPGASLVSVDVLAVTGVDLADVLQQSKRHGLPLMATQVAGKEHMTELARMGFSLFQGAFFKEPELIAGNQLTPGEISRFNLFKIIERDEPDFDALSQTIQTDVSLSLRLLSYLNSTFFSFPQKIRSIRQAVTLLGWDKIRSWLRMILLEDIVKEKNRSELLLLSVQRGKFLEVLGTEHQRPGVEAGSLSLLGTFSLLDAMLQVDMGEIVSHLPLEETLREALLKEEGSPYLPYLELAERVEDPEWEDVESIMEALDLSLEEVTTCVFLASQWVEKLFHPREEREAESPFAKND